MLRTLAVAVLLAVLSAGPAQAAEIGIDGSGATTVLYTLAERPGVGSVVRQPDGRFGGPVLLSEPAQCVSPADLAVAPSGAAVALLSRSEVVPGTPVTRLARDERAIQATVRPAGGVFGRVHQLTAFDQLIRPGAAAIGDTGTALVGWEDDQADLVARGTPAGFDPGGAGPRNAVFDVAGDGTLVSAWIGTDGRTWAAVGSVSGGPGEPRVLEQPETGPAPGGTVAVDARPNGRAAIARFRSESPRSKLLVASRRADGTWSGMTEIPPRDDPSGAAATTGVTGVALMPDGSVLTVWPRATPGVAPALYAATLAPSGRWSEVQDLATPGPLVSFYGDPRLAVNERGDAAVVHDAGKGPRIHLRGAGEERFTLRAGFDEHTTQPDLAVDPAGDAQIVWSGAGSLSTTAFAVVSRDREPSRVVLDNPPLSAAPFPNCRRTLPPNPIVELAAERLRVHRDRRSVTVPLRCVSPSGAECRGRLVLAGRTSRFVVAAGAVLRTRRPVPRLLRRSLGRGRSVRVEAITELDDELGIGPWASTVVRLLPPRRR